LHSQKAEDDPGHGHQRDTKAEKQKHFHPQDWQRRAPDTAPITSLSAPQPPYLQTFFYLETVNEEEKKQTVSSFSLCLLLSLAFT
jgi:hypothetical protein